MLRRGSRRGSRSSDRGSAGRLAPSLNNLNISRGDWWIVTSAYSNVLIEGSDATIESVIAALRAQLRAPVRDWRLGMGTAESMAGTILVRGVDRLDVETQRSLLDFLSSKGVSGALQVVSTSGQPVFPLINRGLFLEELYYRLNTVLLHPDKKS